MSKLVRFDWAAKKLLRSKANFGILEGFLSELLLEDIKIKNLIESESNKEKESSKSNRVDLLVENSTGELIIIEIQNTTEDDYLQRILFGTSKLVVEHIDAGKEYSNIKRVISVSIVYFDLGEGEDYLYKGTTKFFGINNNDELKLTDKIKKLVLKENVHDIYPNYYIIKVNQFDDIAKNTLDEWVYFLKHEEVKSGFKAKGLKEAKKKLDIMKLSDKERRQYDAYDKELRDAASDYATFVTNPIKYEKILREEAYKKGEKIWFEKGVIEMVIKMIIHGIPYETISVVSGLSIAEIEKLK
jgi:predicted transposase/invertase (TIGR01784 family)